QLGIWAMIDSEFHAGNVRGIHAELDEAVTDRLGGSQKAGQHLADRSHVTTPSRQGVRGCVGVAKPAPGGIRKPAKPPAKSTWKTTLHGPDDTRRPAHGGARAQRPP